MKPQTRRRMLLVPVAAAVAHVAVWSIVINADGLLDFCCSELSCWVLILIDFPISLLYAGPTEESITMWSLAAGTLWWAMLSLTLLKLAETLLRERA